MGCKAEVALVKDFVDIDSTWGNTSIAVDHRNRELINTPMSKVVSDVGIGKYDSRKV